MPAASFISRAALRVASELWRHARSPEPWRVNGLNGEGAVRRRLGGLARRLVEGSQAPASVRASLGAIDWLLEPPVRVRSMVIELAAHVDDPSSPWARSLARLLVVQHLAARLGWWPPRPDEADDAGVARQLYGPTDAVADRSFTETLRQARQRHALGGDGEALRLWLTADRIHRTPMPLLHAAELLCRLGRVRAACWALRVALLEPVEQFPSAEVYARARRLSAQLSLSLEARAGRPAGAVSRADGSATDDATNLPPAVPPTAPVVTGAVEWFFEGRTAPLDAGSALAALLQTATTSPLVHRPRLAVPDPVPSAPMSAPLSLPPVGPPSLHGVFDTDPERSLADGEATPAEVRLNAPRSETLRRPVLVRRTISWAVARRPLGARVDMLASFPTGAHSTTGLRRREVAWRVDRRPLSSASLRATVVTERVIRGGSASSPEAGAHVSTRPDALVSLDA